MFNIRGKYILELLRIPFIYSGRYILNALIYLIYSTTDGVIFGFAYVPRNLVQTLYAGQHALYKY